MSRFYTHFSLDWDNILLTFYEDGIKGYQRTKISPYLFIDSAIESKYKNLQGKNVQRIDFPDVKSARNFIKNYDGVSNINIYGLPLYHYAYIYDNFKEIEFDRSQINILNIDLETDTIGGFPDIQAANKEINVITLKLFGSKNIYTIGIGEYEPKEAELVNSDYKINYTNCLNEKELLIELIKRWQFLSPDVLTGWNIKGFDLPYIYKRICQVLSENYAKKLSPFNKVTTSTTVVYNKEMTLVDFAGISILDYMDVYKKFHPGIEESYSLNYISNKILGSSKLDYSEYGSLAKLQEQNWEKFVSYNIIDVIRVEEIDEKIDFMSIAFEIAYETKSNYEDCLGTIRVWDSLIHSYLMDKNIVVPTKTGQNSKTRQIAGGFVKDVRVGKYDWVMSFDFKSLYPSLCMTFNISPETYLGKFESIIDNPVDKILNLSLENHKERMKEDNFTVTGCGTIFSRKQQGFIPALMERLFAIRKEYSDLEDKFTRDYTTTKNPEDKAKALIYGNKSAATKILLNSGYGVLSNEYFRFFSDDIAESFTLSGQLAIKNVERHINKRLNSVMKTDGIDYIVAIDTDSVYIDVSEVAKKTSSDDKVGFLERFSDKVGEWIRESVIELYEMTNAYSDKLSMSLEAIGAGIWVAKKRYIMSIPSFKKIRFNPPKIKIQGIEAVRSTTPKIIRDWISDSIPLLLDGDSSKIKRFIDDKWDEFINLPYSELSMPKGTNDLEKYYHPTEIFKTGTPQHVKGALIYNDFIRKNSLDKKIDFIKSGDKVRVCYLKMPNPLMVDNIATHEMIYDEIKFIEEFIDYDKMFTKSFLNPIKKITDAASISIHNEIDIDNFF